MVLKSKIGGRIKMTTLLENIIDYYIYETMLKTGIDKDSAVLALGEALQNEDVELYIMEYIENHV
jgi:hypothetical protein